MHTLILFIKSYRNDYSSVKKLISSIYIFNKDNIPVYLSVNDEDYDFFKGKFENVALVKDSDIISCTIQDPWRYQQVIKSSVHKLGICKNYLCLDSDSEFITNFYLKNFLYKNDVPYTVMHESKFFLEMAENIDIDSSQIFFKNATRATRQLMDISDTEKIWDFGPSPYLWSTKVWLEIEEYLIRKNHTFESFLMAVSDITSPSENVIYGEFLRTYKTMDIIPVGPFFKVYHFKKQYALEQKFHKLEKLQKVYLGIIFQSNWKRSFFNKLFKKK